MKRAVTFVSIVIFCMAISAYSNALSTETRGNDSVTSVSAEDVEMNRIIENARKNINIFLKELNNPNTKGSDFAVKYPFDTDAGSQLTKEHIWLTDIEKKGNKYYGIVANDPFYIKKMKNGDRVEFNIKMVSDWKYVEDGYLVGGESVVYFYNQMTPQEKKDFERNIGVKIKKK